MSNFALKNRDMLTQFTLLYNLKKNVSEAHQMLVGAYGEHVMNGLK